MSEQNVDIDAKQFADIMWRKVLDSAAPDGEGGVVVEISVDMVARSTRRDGAPATRKANP